MCDSLAGLWRQPKSWGAGLGGLAVLICIAFATPAAAQSVRSTAQEAILSHPRVSVVARNREAVEQELARARGLFLPQIDLRVGGGPERTDNASTRARGGTVGLTRRDSSVIATQRVFDGWETSSEVGRQRARAESAAYRVAEAAELVALDAIEAHVEVVRQRVLVGFATANVEAHREIVAKVMARSGGLTPSGEAEQASARLDSATATAIEARAALEEAENRYLAMVNRRPGALDPAPYPEAGLRDYGTLESLQERARANNRTLKITKTDIRVSERELEGTESAFYPKVNLELSASRNRNLDGTRGDDNDASALLVMRWNLYRGGSDTAQRNVALGRMSQSIAQHHIASRSSEEEIRRAWIQREAAVERIPVLRSAVEKSIRVRDTYQTQFLTRERSLIDVLNAENEVFVSQSRLVAAETARLTSSYRLLAFAGELLPALDLAPLAEADPARPAAPPSDPRRDAAR